MKTYNEFLMTNTFEDFIKILKIYKTCNTSSEGDKNILKVFFDYSEYHYLKCITDNDLKTIFVDKGYPKHIIDVVFDNFREKSNDVIEAFRKHGFMDARGIITYYNMNKLGTKLDLKENELGCSPSIYLFNKQLETVLKTDFNDKNFFINDIVFKEIRYIFDFKEAIYQYEYLYTLEPNNFIQHMINSYKKMLDEIILYTKEISFEYQNKYLTKFKRTFEWHETRISQINKTN